MNWEKQDMEGKTDLFHRLWTLKESYAKFMGMGLVIPFETLNFKWEECKVGFCRNGKIDSSCYFLSKKLGMDYYMAICTDRSEEKNVVAVPDWIMWQRLFAM